MKKKGLILLVLVCALFLVVGCNKDNNSTNNNSSNTSTKKDSKKSNDSSLVGSWEYETGGFTYVFNKDGTGKYDLGSSVMEFTWTTNGNKLSIFYEDTDVPFETTYKIDGKTLTIKDSLDEDVKYIKK